MADIDNDKTDPHVAEEATETPDMPRPEDRTVIRPIEDEEEATPAKPHAELPYMVVVDGPRIGARFSLLAGPNLIGRTTTNTIQLDDQSVSRQHAEINRGESGITVRDLGSKNGSYVNGALITDATVIGHKDVVKTGIYQLRLITKPIGVEEELTLPPELASADRTVFVSAPPESETARLGSAEEIEEIEESGSFLPPPDDDRGDFPGPEDEVPQPKASRRRPIVMLGALLVMIFVVGGYFGYRHFFKAPKTKARSAKVDKKAAAKDAGAKKKTTEKAPAVKASEDQPKAAAKKTESEGKTEATSEKALAAMPAKTTPGIPEQGATAKTPSPKTAPPAKSAVPKIPVFLDFASSPTTATVTFQGKELGATPLRVNVELEPGKTYTTEARFMMEDVKEQYTQRAEFTVELGKSVIPILFRGPIGIIKIDDLPRDVQLYIEGRFAYDKFQERSAKIKEVILGKPFYVPYGEYLIELRRSRQMGETSPTFIEDIIFRREFVLAEESPAFALEIKEGDLETFPVKIKSEPASADVYIDSKKVGKTPFEGTFPLGEHKLTVRKEGYFEHSEDLKVDINTPFVANVKLKTSLAGAHVNNARLAMNRQMYQDAINELAEALNSEPAPSEVALANYLLGVCYLSLNDIQRAMGYFEQAKTNDEYRNQALLGLVEGYARMKALNKALPLLVEVLLKAEDEGVKREANDLFQKLSPFRSVLYVYSEPPGANVVVNDKPVAQKTPVILHELPLGNYRIRIEKSGYLPTDLNISLAVNEFNPVIVKLKPIPE